jgi:hypothetical protein
MAIQGKDSLVGEGGHAAFFCSFGGEPGRMVEHSRVVAEGAPRGAFAPHTIPRGRDLLRTALVGEDCARYELAAGWAGSGVCGAPLAAPRRTGTATRTALRIAGTIGATRDSARGSGPSVRRRLRPAAGSHTCNPARENRIGARRRSPTAWPGAAAPCLRWWKAAERGRS